MKYVLILMLHFNWSVATSTAVFGSKESCELGIKHIQESMTIWERVEFKAFCIPQGVEYQ